MPQEEEGGWIGRSGSRRIGAPTSGRGGGTQRGPPSGQMTAWVNEKRADRRHLEGPWPRGGVAFSEGFRED